MKQANIIIIIIIMISICSYTNRLTHCDLSTTGVSRLSFESVGRPAAGEYHLIFVNSGKFLTQNVRHLAVIINNAYLSQRQRGQIIKKCPDCSSDCRCGLNETKKCF